MIDFIEPLRIGDIITHKTVDQIIYKYRVNGVDEEGNITRLMLARRPKKLPRLDEIDEVLMNYDH